jgi:hypothetical protein
VAWLAVRHAATRETLLYEPTGPVPRPALPAGYAIAIVLGLLVFPRLAVFGYLALALWQVSVARGERTIS